MEYYDPLKILAKDEEDLDIVLALLQDALMPVVSIVYDDINKTMTFLANRFCWEIPEEEFENDSLYYRVHAGLLFKGVNSVHEKNIHKNQKNNLLSFLMSKIEKATDGYHIYLYFSEDACIRLSVSFIDCVLADIDEPWSTRTIPMHPGNDILEEDSAYS